MRRGGTREYRAASRTPRRVATLSHISEPFELIEGVQRSAVVHPLPLLRGEWGYRHVPGSVFEDAVALLGPDGHDTMAYDTGSWDNGHPSEWDAATLDAAEANSDRVPVQPAVARELGWRESIYAPMWFSGDGRDVTNQVTETLLQGPREAAVLPQRWITPDMVRRFQPIFKQDLLASTS